MKKTPRAAGALTAPATRIERDTMGELAVPATAYYGVQTARALENFPISSLRFPRAMIRAMGLIKRAAATVNQSLGLLDRNRGGDQHADRSGRVNSCGFRSTHPDWFSTRRT
jgi:fumarate hydratase class II